jgi:hypothetical protein
VDGQGLTAGDFEAGLEERLLAAKLKHHQTAAQAVESFSARRTDFERLQVAQVLVDRDDLARELVCRAEAVMTGSVPRPRTLAGASSISDRGSRWSGQQGEWFPPRTNSRWFNVLEGKLCCDR